METEKEEIKLKSKDIKTYTDEMVKAIESDQGGLIKKIIHEEEEHEALKKNISPGSQKNRLFMIISVLLIILALAILVFLAFFTKKINTISVTPQFTSMIFADQTDFLPIDGLTREKISETILNQISNTKVKLGGVDGIYLTEGKQIIGFNRFNTLLKSSLSTEQLNLFNDDNNELARRI